VVLMSSDETADPRGCPAAAAFLPKQRLRAAALRQLWERHAPLR
jgi:hypothetical protein